MGERGNFSINPEVNILGFLTTKISSLGWKPKITFEEGLKKTIGWYLNNLDWSQSMREKSGYWGNRIGNIN